MDNDVRAWMVSLGFKQVATHEDQPLYSQNGMYLIDIEQATFFYTIHHTALTSFRDEVLNAGPKNKLGEQSHITKDGFEIWICQEHGEYDCNCIGFNVSNDEWRKAIQTISERHKL